MVLAQQHTTLFSKVVEKKYYKLNTARDTRGLTLAGLLK